MTRTRKNSLHEPAMLSDSDIVSNTKSTGASIRSNELRDADLTVVTGGMFGFPLGVIYRPGTSGTGGGGGYPTGTGGGQPGGFPLGRVYVPH
jgi:hypothetical protein